MIEALAAIYIWAQQPSSSVFEEVRRYRVYRPRKRKLKGDLLDGCCWPEAPTFEALWNYRVGSWKSRL